MPTWQESGQRCNELADGELHIWIADLDEVAEPATHTLLSADERRRADRIANSLEGLRWARSRATLRLLLGSYLRSDPSSLSFEHGERGKPELADDHPSAHAQASLAGGSKLCFNLSHSRGTALFAFARGISVGVDVEQGGRRLDTLALAKRAWGADMADGLRSLQGPARERAFLRAWVRHEASLKCRGWGLSAGRKCEITPQLWIADLDVGLAAAGAPGAARTVAAATTVRAAGAVAAAREPATIRHLRGRFG